MHPLKQNITMSMMSRLPALRIVMIGDSEKRMSSEIFGAWYSGPFAY